MANELKPITNNSYHKAQFIQENNKNMFKKCSTKHLKFKFYKQEKLYIPPKMFEIGEEDVFVIRDSEIILGDKKKSLESSHSLK